MTFSEKIDKILRTNRIGVGSVNALEKAIGVSNGTIGAPYRKNEEPGKRTIKRILEKFGVSPDWWYQDEGDMYLRDELYLDENRNKGSNNDEHKIELIKKIEKQERYINQLEFLVDNYRGQVSTYKEQNNALTEKITKLELLLKKR